MKGKLVIFQSNYPFKVWASTVCLATFIFCIYDACGEKFDLLEFLNNAFQLTGVNAFISLPALGFFWLVFSLLNKLRMSLFIKRVSLILIAFALVLLTWYLINALFDRQVFYEQSSYFIYVNFFICIVASSLFFSREDYFLE